MRDCQHIGGEDPVSNEKKQLSTIQQQRIQQQSHITNTINAQKTFQSVRNSCMCQSPGFFTSSSQQPYTPVYRKNYRPKSIKERFLRR